MSILTLTDPRRLLSELMNVAEASPRYLGDEQVARMEYCHNAALTAYGATKAGTQGTVVTGVGVARVGLDAARLFRWHT